MNKNNINNHTLYCNKFKMKLNRNILIYINQILK